MSLLELPPWKLDFLQSLDWRLFETLCAKVFSEAGYQATELNQGPDGEINLQLKIGNDSAKKIAVRCRRQKDSITAEQVKEFHRFAEDVGANNFIFVSSGTFEDKCLSEFKRAHQLRLIDGKQFIEGMQDLGRDKANDLMKFVLGQAEWSIPTCPDCRVKMMRRVDREKKTAHWGCDTPHCNCTMPVE